MRILITGSRDWADTKVIEDAILETAKGRPAVIVHGGARGADTIADAVAGHWCFHTEEHRADWAKYGKAAGPIRNQHMVDLGADACLAFPLGESRGTRDCMRRAAAAGIPVRDFGESA